MMDTERLEAGWRSCPCMPIILLTLRNWNFPAGSDGSASMSALCTAKAGPARRVWAMWRRVSGNADVMLTA